MVKFAVLFGQCKSLLRYTAGVLWCKCACSRESYPFHLGCLQKTLKRRRVRRTCRSVWPSWVTQPVGAIACGSLIPLGVMAGREAWSQMHLTDVFLSMRPQLSWIHMTAATFARSLGSILCKIQISLPFEVCFYWCLTFTLLWLSNSASFQRTVRSYR